MSDYWCIGNPRLEGTLKCMHFSQIHVMIFSKSGALVNFFFKYKKNVYKRTNVTYSMFYSRQKFWLLQQKYIPQENHFISMSRLQIL